MAYLLAASTGFAPGMAPVHAAARAAAPLMAEYSAAVPFLKKPPALDGSMPGDRGFDPLGFTKYGSEKTLAWCRATLTRRGLQCGYPCRGELAV